MKGVHPILSHSALLIVGLVAMTMIVVSITATFSNTQSNLAKAQARYVAESARDSILDVYSIAVQSDYTNGSFDMGLPEIIGGSKYMLILDNDTVSVRTASGKDTSDVNLTLGIDVSLHGESYMPALLHVLKEEGVTIWLGE